MGDKVMVRGIQHHDTATVSVGVTLHNIQCRGRHLKHGRMLKQKKNVILPFEKLPRHEGRKIVVKKTSLTTTMAFKKEFVGHNVNAADQGMTREELAPRAKSVEGGIMATWKGLMKSLQIVGGGENGAVLNNDLVASNVRLMKVLVRKGASQRGQ
jgi:hypothetical protein